MTAPALARALWLLLLAAGAACAWPADVYVDLEAGAERFQRLSALDWVEVEDPSVATAEVLDSGELLLTGKSPGRTLLLLYAEGKVAVWRLRVAAKGAKPKVEPEGGALAAARTACPDLKVDGSNLTVTIKDERCRQALLALFKTDAFSARDLELTFEVAALQAQLSALQLGAQVEAQYAGAGLILKGKLPEKVYRRVLWQVFQRSVGRVALEDRVELITGNDGGS